MNLVIDLGNTMIKFGLFEQERLIKTFLVNTDRNKSEDEYLIIIRSLIGDELKIEGAIISSVVPALTLNITNAIKKLYGIECLIVSKNLKTKMAIKIDNPNELGADMLVGAIGAHKKYGNSLLVCDVGTATKIYIIDKNGAFNGGIITTGLGASLKSLVSSTSLLLEVPLVAPKKYIGRNTKDCIQSGVVLGQVLMIQEFAKKFETELGYGLKKIITGGFCKVFSENLEDFIFDNDLTLEGLNEVFKLNSYEK